jgi:hypothetical protein
LAALGSSLVLLGLACSPRSALADAFFAPTSPKFAPDVSTHLAEDGSPSLRIGIFPASVTSLSTQIWHYDALNRKYTFIDRDGFGRYVLVSETGP